MVVETLDSIWIVRLLKGKVLTRVGRHVAKTALCWAEMHGPLDGLNPTYLKLNFRNGTILQNMLDSKQLAKVHIPSNLDL